MRRWVTFHIMWIYSCRKLKNFNSVWLKCFNIPELRFLFLKHNHIFKIDLLKMHLLHKGRLFWEIWGRLKWRAKIFDKIENFRKIFFYQRASFWQNITVLCKHICQICSSQQSFDPFYGTVRATYTMHVLFPRSS